MDARAATEALEGPSENLGTADQMNHVRARAVIERDRIRGPAWPSWLTERDAAHSVRVVLTVGAGEAKTQLSRLLRAVEQGDEVVIQRDGRPVARLVPVEPAGRRFGQFAGRLRVAEDVDDPLPGPVLELFE